MLCGVLAEADPGFGGTFLAFLSALGGVGMVLVV